MILYVKDHCAFSARALKAVEVLGAELTIKNKKDEGVIDEVVAKGGKQQFPFLFDEESNTTLYESEEIVKYLCEKFGGNPEDFSQEVADICSLD